MPNQQPNKALKLFIGTALLIGLIAFYSGEFTNKKWQPPSSITSKTHATEDKFTLSQRAKTHILYGDHSGGGHIYGTGKPCKSEFPQDWDKDEIIKTIEKIATNNNLDWRKQNNGYYVTNRKVNGLKIRVVLSTNKKEVITAYPINVKRNYCPKDSNNNIKP